MIMWGNPDYRESPKCRNLVWLPFKPLCAPGNALWWVRDYKDRGLLLVFWDRTMGLYPLPNVTVLAGIKPPRHTLLLLNVEWPLLGNLPYKQILLIQASKKGSSNTHCSVWHTPTRRERAQGHSWICPFNPLQVLLPSLGCDRDGWRQSLGVVERNCTHIIPH